MVYSDVEGDSRHIVDRFPAEESLHILFATQHWVPTCFAALHAHCSRKSACKWWLHTLSIVQARPPALHDHQVLLERRLHPRAAPPRAGAQVELKGMADRINAMRTTLFEALQAERVPGGWSHVVDQIGMCAPNPLPPPCCCLIKSHRWRHTEAAVQCSCKIKCRRRQ